MNITANRIAGLATLALAALPLAALSTTAHAAPARIKVSDLDLNSQAGLVVFQQRAMAAEKVFCGDNKQLSSLAACRRVARSEIAQKLTDAQQRQLASRNGATLASR